MLFSTTQRAENGSQAHHVVTTMRSIILMDPARETLYGWLSLATNQQRAGAEPARHGRTEEPVLAESLLTVSAFTYGVTSDIY